MPLFLENRTKILIALIIFIFCVYTAEAFIVEGQNTLNRYSELEEEYEEGQGYNPEVNTTGVEMELGEGTDVFALMEGVFKFLTFQFIEMPYGAMLFMTILMIIVGILTIMVFISFVYDFIKALPFT